VRVPVIVLLLIAGCAAPGGVEGVRRHYKLRPAARGADPAELEAASRWLDAGELRFRAGGADGYRQAAHDVWRWLESAKGASDEDRRRARRLYNHAVAGYVIETGVRVQPGAMMYSAYNIKTHFPSADGAQGGFGAPFVIVRDGRSEEFGEGLVTGAHDQIVPTTVILRFAQGAPRLTFHDPLRESHVGLHGGYLPLESNVMAALELRLVATDVGEWRRDAALNPAMDQAGFSLMESPRNDKIPVLFVHGLQHSPTDFAKMFAGLLRDPTIRTRYQFINYRWATGLPLPISVGIFRRQLAEFWTWFEAGAPEARRRGYWVLSHSMGGLLAKTLAVDSGSRIVDAMFRVPRSEVDLDSELGRRVERALVYRPDPKLAGVIFMAVPHRGSGFAASAIGDIGAELIHPGEESERLMHELAERYGDQLKPEVLALLRGKTTSMQNLRPDDWYLRALAACPFSPDIPYHSIIGDLFGTEDLRVGDGAVAYKSAHLDGATSETVIRAPHNLHKTKAGLAAVKTILLAYLE